MKRITYQAMWVAVALSLSAVACEKDQKAPPSGQYGTMDPAKPGAPSGTGALAAPTADKLAEYTKGIPGTGKLAAVIQTEYGAITCQLYEKEVPVTVANFVGLARGLHPWRDPRSGQVQQGKKFYDGTVCHRLIPGFMMQCGDPTGTGTSGPGYKFADEFRPELRHDQPATLSMANAGPGTNGSQFFITERPTPHLDGRHTVFGRCAPLDVVRTINRVPKAPGNSSKPAKDVVLKSVTIVRQ